MPHRLRRVIGVNIFDPHSKRPSGRFAQLDTRGAVNAVGRNGVGKTSFLRLIPLFYGATPSQILKGSGHHTMIRHMLPDASSAVVYEYERESETDLRCAVMYAAPGDLDMACFYIMEAGFEERFFENEAGEFLRRDEFKAHAEALGARVTPQLSMARWRAVILNDIEDVRDAGRMRELANRHSLGLGSLRGMDRIAAAMGPEAISFEVLQEIVVEQVMQEITVGGRDRSRDLKKSASDVRRWLEDVDHLGKLKAREEDFHKLSALCTELRGVDTELRAMRACAQDLSARLAERHVDAEREVGHIEQAGKEADERLRDEHGQASAGAETARAKARADTLAEESLRGRLAYFQTYRDKGIEHFLREQQREPQLRTEQSEIESRLRELDLAAQGVSDTFGARRTAIERRKGDTLNALAGQLAALGTEKDERLNALLEQQGNQREALTARPRAREVAAEISQAETRIAALTEQIKRPEASQLTRNRLEQTARALREAGVQAKQRGVQQRTAQNGAQDALRARNKAEQEHSRAKAEAERLDGVRRDLLEQLRPPAGSLLAFLRSTAEGELGPERVAAIARVLDPRLAQRADLHPAVIRSEAPSHDPTQAVNVDGLLLDVGALGQPGWLTAEDVRLELQRLEPALGEAAAALEAAVRTLRRAQDGLDQAEQESIAASSALNHAQEEVTRLEGELEELEALASQERAGEAERLEAEKTAMQGRLTELGAEQELLQQQEKEDRERLSIAHKQELQDLQSEFERRAAAISEAQGQAQARADQELELLASEEAGELAARGVDPELVANLRARVQAIQDTLQAISDHRADVAAWVRFRDGELPQLDQLARDATESSRLAAAAGERVGALERAQREHAEDVQQRLSAARQRVSQLQRDRETVNVVLARQLYGIGLPLHGFHAITLTADELDARATALAARKRSAADQTSELWTQLRNLMRLRDGPASEWLARRDADAAASEPGDALPDHLRVLARAEILREWVSGPMDDAVSQLNQDLNGMLELAAAFATVLTNFDVQVEKFNRALQKQLDRVSPFPSFQDLKVTIASTVGELEFMPVLTAMRDAASSLQSRSAIVQLGRNANMPRPETVQLMRNFLDLLGRDGGISWRAADQVSLQCELVINGARQKIASAQAFKTHASNGNTAMIVAMFLLGFAGMVRRSSRAPVRVTWITDEVGRFDASNLQQFLKVLDENNVDVIVAQPMPNPATSDLYDTECRFSKGGAIWTASVTHDDWDEIAPEPGVTPAAPAGGGLNGAALQGGAHGAA